MKILDRYILRQFLLNLVIIFVVLVSLYVLVDLIIQLDRFMEAGNIRAVQARFGALADAGRAREVPFTSVVRWTLYSIFDYYYPVLFPFYVFFSGLLMVAAMGFTFAGLSRTGELVAMVTGGISMYRIAAPVIVVGCLLIGLAIPINDFIIPRLANKLVRGPSQIKFESLDKFRVDYAPDGQGNLLSARSFDPTHATMEDLTVLVRNEHGQVRQRITAAAALWDEARTGWVLRGGKTLERRLGNGATANPNQTTAQTATFYATDLSPQMLVAKRSALYTQLLSLRELMEMAHSSAADTAAILRVVHSRFSMLVVNVLILVMALPFFLTREPVNYMVQSLRAVGLSLAAWSTGLLLVQAGTGLNPVTAAWLPVALLLPISAWLLHGVKT